MDLRHHVDDLRKRRNDLEVEHSLLEQLTSLWERLCKEVESEIQEGVKQQLGFQDSISTGPQPTPESNQEEQQQQAKTVIVMQRGGSCSNIKTVYPNTRGKRKIAEETGKTNKGRKRILIDDFAGEVMATENVHLQSRLDDVSCLLLNDEVVPQVCSQETSQCSMTTALTTTATTTTATSAAAEALNAYIKAENLMEANEHET